MSQTTTTATTTTRMEGQFLSQPTLARVLCVLSVQGNSNVVPAYDFLSSRPPLPPTMSDHGSVHLCLGYQTMQ